MKRNHKDGANTHTHSCGHLPFIIKKCSSFFFFSTNDTTQGCSVCIRAHKWPTNLIKPHYPLMLHWYDDVNERSSVHVRVCGAQMCVCVCWLKWLFLCLCLFTGWRLHKFFTALKKSEECDCSVQMCVDWCLHVVFIFFKLSLCHHCLVVSWWCQNWGGLYWLLYKACIQKT